MPDLIQTFGTILGGDDIRPAIEKKLLYQAADLVIVVYDDQHLSAVRPYQRMSWRRYSAPAKIAQDLWLTTGWICTPPISPYGNLDASVAEFRGTPRRRYQGVVRAVIPSLDNFGRNARCY